MQVADLYEDLKKRVSQFNMHVEENPQPLDYTSTHRQKFILQVRVSAAHRRMHITYMMSEVQVKLNSAHFRSSLNKYSAAEYTHLNVSLF